MTLILSLIHIYILIDMRDREKSFKQKIKEERKELKQDREKLTKLLIEKQKHRRIFPALSPSRETGNIIR